MKTRIFPLPATMGRLRAAATLALCCAALSAFGRPFSEFWITEAISGRTVGPIVDKPGNQFAACGRTWVVLQSETGQINFADAETLDPQGPYDFVEHRVFDLGALACVFSRIRAFAGGDPSADRAIVTQAVRAPAPRGATMPQRWVLAPVPSTNPGAHKDEFKSWAAKRFHPKTSAYAFLEPVHITQYDWKLGGMGGRRKEPLRATRFGAAVEWHGFDMEAGLSSSAKTSGTLVDDGLSVSALKLRGGNGWFVAGGWTWALQVADGWSASLGVRAAYESLSADASATTLRPTSSSASAAGGNEGSGAESPDVVTSPGYGFAAWKGEADMTEFLVRGVAGVRYDDWYWGAGLSFSVDCFTDASTDADIPVVTKTYRLEADRSQPVELGLSGWYTPDDLFVLRGAVTVGSEVSVRLGIGLLF